MQWTQSELEKLYRDINAKAIADEEFQKQLCENPKETIEKFAGKEVPGDFNLKFIEQDNGYAATYVVPDFVQGELDFKQLRDEETETVGGGLSIALIVSICGAAASVGGCPADACGAAACGGNICGGNACGGAACGGNACAGNAGGAGACGGAACGGNAGGAGACGGNACGADASGGSTCSGATCGANI